MDNFLQFDTISLILFALVGILVVLIWQFTDHNGFDIKNIIIDQKTKQVSLMKLGQLIALMISSWAFVYETRAGRLSEWLFIGYMTAWSGANLLSKWIDVKNKSNLHNEQFESDKFLSDREKY